jgi:predicted transcriptional regulator
MGEKNIPKERISYFGILVNTLLFLWSVGKTIYSAGQEKLQKLLISTREKAGLTQAAVANKLNRPQSFVSKYESGERRLDLIELAEICKAMGTSLVEFVKQFERT